MARDNFTQKVINDLRNRVGLRCSNPDCRVPTIAPSNNIGQAAHICAASSGGPRYDKSMTTEERKSINNAIWLCANHATEIDRNPDAFPVELLYRWKQEAEELATKELGKKLPSDSDAIDMVSSALTGLPTTFLPTAISNIHLATKKSLEELDSRFLVTTSHINNLTSFEIQAKEKVVLSMNVHNAYAKEFNQKYRKLLEEGKDFKIDAMAINFKGSKLFEEIDSYREGQFSLTTSKQKAIQKLWIMDKKTKSIESFDDIVGEIAFGSKFFRFEGTTFDGLVYFNYQHSLDTRVNNGVINMGISFEKWNDIEINKLPYFRKIFLLFLKISQKWDMYTSLEIYGEKVFTSIEIDINIDSMSCYLQYINRCRIIANYLNVKIPFVAEADYTREEHIELAKVANIIEKKEILYKNDLKCNPHLTFKAGQNISKTFMTEKEQSYEIKFVEVANTKIKIFNKYLSLPNKIIFYKSVCISFNKDVTLITEGEEIKAELIPQEDFEYRIEFEES